MITMASAAVPSTIGSAKTNDMDNFIRLHLAVQYLCQQLIPCIDDSVRNWHGRERQRLQPCQSPQQCATKGKPKLGKSCPACIAWGHAVDAAVYCKTRQATWTNVDPTRLHHDPIEAVKAFVLRLVPGKNYTNLGDFDAACLIMVMMNFGNIHGNNPFVHGKIKQVCTVRNALSHVNVEDNLKINGTEMESSFEAINELMKALITIQPKYFNADMCTEIKKLKSQRITSDVAMKVLTELKGDIRGLRQNMDSLTREVQEIKQHTSVGAENVPKEETFNLVACRRELRHFYLQTLCKIPQFPGVRHDYLKMDDIYTNVSIIIHLPKPCTPIQIPLDSHHDIFKSHDSDGISPTRVLVLGSPGCRKSILTLKLAHDWAVKDSDSPLKNIDLLFALNMRWMTPETTLEDAIFDQLLPDDTEISKSTLRNYIKRNQSSCVLLFDAFDEYGFSGEIGNKKSGVHGIIANSELRECLVLVTSRFWKSRYFDELQNAYTHMQINGFSNEYVVKYIYKFFSRDRASGEKLISYLKDHNLSPGIANVPLMTLLLCLYWKESDGQTIPNKIGDVYDEIFKLLQKQYLSKNVGDAFDLVPLIRSAGKLAFKGLWSSKDQLVFSLDEFISQSSEQTLSAGCQIGLLSTQQNRKRAISVLQSENQGILASKSDHHRAPTTDEVVASTQDTSVTFFHKSCQEKCAGEYFASMYSISPSDFEAAMQCLDSSNTCIRLEMVLRFACGASPVVANRILQKLIQVFQSEFVKHLQEYYQESLAPDFAKCFQMFIELCLQCYYECPDITDTLLQEQLLNSLNQLFSLGQMLFIGMSPHTSSAIGKYILRAKNIRCVTLKAVPSPTCSDEGILPNGVITNSFAIMQQALKHLPRDKLERLYRRETRYPNYSQFQNLCLTETVNYFKDWHSSHNVNVNPILTSLENECGLDALQLFNVPIATLLRVINHGSLITLTTLRLFNSGLTNEQVDCLLESVPENLPRLESLDTCFNKARLTRLGDCLVNSQIHSLLVYDMRAPAEDIRDVARKLPQYGSRMKALEMDRNEIDDDTGKVLADGMTCTYQLHRFSMSMDMLKKNTHNKVINAINHFAQLTYLRIVDSPYLEDLFQCLANSMASTPHLQTLWLWSLQAQSAQQSTQPSMARLVLCARPKGTGEGVKAIRRSSCQQLISRLDCMTNMRKLYLLGICLHKEDLITLLTLCSRHKYTYFGYSRHLFPDDIDGTQYEFLHFG